VLIFDIDILHTLSMLYILIIILYEIKSSLCYTQIFLHSIIHHNTAHGNYMIWVIWENSQFKIVSSMTISVGKHILSYRFSIYLKIHWFIKVIHWFIKVTHWIVEFFTLLVLQWSQLRQNHCSWTQYFLELFLAVQWCVHGLLIHNGKHHLKVTNSCVHYLVWIMKLRW
jgi:hypothetical protein